MTATKTKEKNKQVTTQTGVASYPFLTRPNTKFDSDGEYRVNLILPLKEAKDLMKTIDVAMKESLEAAKKENPKKASKIKLANTPYSMVTDDEGKETGNVQFNFKMKAKITPRNGGEPFEVRPAIFDATGQPISKTLSIGSGTKMKVCADLVPYFTDLVGAGISLRLKAVQIIELVEYQGQTADRFGFDSEEGYTQTANDEGEEVSDEDVPF